MSFTGQVYNVLFKRTSTFALTALVSVFFFERAFDLGSEVMFDKYNAGKLFKDMKKEE